MSFSKRPDGEVEVGRGYLQRHTRYIANHHLHGFIFLSDWSKTAPGTFPISKGNITWEGVVSHTAILAKWMKPWWSGETGRASIGDGSCRDQGCRGSTASIKCQDY